MKEGNKKFFSIVSIIFIILSINSVIAESYLSGNSDGSYFSKLMCNLGIGKNCTKSITGNAVYTSIGSGSCPTNANFKVPITYLKGFMSANHDSKLFTIVQPVSDSLYPSGVIKDTLYSPEDLEFILANDSLTKLNLPNNFVTCNLKLKNGQYPILKSGFIDVKDDLRANSIDMKVAVANYYGIMNTLEYQMMSSLEAISAINVYLGETPIIPSEVFPDNSNPFKPQILQKENALISNPVQINQAVYRNGLKTFLNEQILPLEKKRIELNAERESALAQHDDARAEELKDKVNEIDNSIKALKSINYPLSLGPTFEANYYFFNNIPILDTSNDEFVGDIDVAIKEQLKSSRTSLISYFDLLEQTAILMNNPDSTYSSVDSNLKQILPKTTPFPKLVVNPNDDPATRYKRIKANEYLLIANKALKYKSDIDKAYWEDFTSPGNQVLIIAPMFVLGVVAGPLSTASALVRAAATGSPGVSSSSAVAGLFFVGASAAFTYPAISEARRVCNGVFDSQVGASSSVFGPTEMSDYRNCMNSWIWVGIQSALTVGIPESVATFMKSSNPVARKVVLILDDGGMVAKNIIESEQVIAPNIVNIYRPGLSPDEIRVLMARNVQKFYSAPILKRVEEARILKGSPLTMSEVQAVFNAHPQEAGLAVIGNKRMTDIIMDENALNVIRTGDLTAEANNIVSPSVTSQISAFENPVLVNTLNSLPEVQQFTNNLGVVRVVGRFTSINGNYEQILLDALLAAKTEGYKYLVIEVDSVHARFWDRLFNKRGQPPALLKVNYDIQRVDLLDDLGNVIVSENGQPVSRMARVNKNVPGVPNSVDISGNVAVPGVGDVPHTGNLQYNVGVLDVDKAIEVLSN